MKIKWKNTLGMVVVIGFLVFTGITEAVPQAGGEPAELEAPQSLLTVETSEKETNKIDYSGVEYFVFSPLAVLKGKAEELFGYRGTIIYEESAELEQLPKGPKLQITF